MHMKIYEREPLTYRRTIPVFSFESDYTNNYEKIATYHMETEQQTGRNPWIQEDLWVEMEKSTVELIRKYAEGRQRILDVGVGLGRVLSQFPEMERFGMDISLDYLEEAQRKGINVCYALVEDMPYTEEFFDIVVCTDVLEHVLDLNLACAKILKTLKKSGILIVRVPYREDLSPYLLENDLYQYSHLRNFDEHSLRLLLEKIFKCEVIETVLTGYSALSLKMKDTISISQDSKTVNNIIRMLKGMLRSAGYILKLFSKNLYRSFSKMVYRPTEINVVAIKKGRPDRLHQIPSTLPLVTPSTQ